MISPYLSFNGECRQAFEFYASCMGANITAMFRYADAPHDQGLPEQWDERVMHASLELSGSILMGSDARPGLYTRPQGFAVEYGALDEAATQRVFEALGEGGQVILPLEKTFWTAAFGVVTDRFGIPWNIHCSNSN